MDLVGLRLRLDEDVPDLPRGRLLELRLVLVVVGLNVLVGDLDFARDLLEDLLGKQPGMERGEHLLLRLAGLLELRLVGLVVAVEVLVLELVEALVDLLVRHGDVALLGRELVLGLLDKVADDRGAKLRELGRSGRGELLSLSFALLLRGREQPVVFGLRNLTVPDERNRIRGHVGGLAVVVVPAASGGRDREGERSEKSDETSPKRHGRS